MKEESKEALLDKNQEGTETGELPDESTTDSGQPDGELADLKDKYLRLAAEYDNFRKRTQREREFLYNDIKADVLTPLLAVLDNLERAVGAPTEDTAYAQGIEMICRQLIETLGKQGITEIDTSDGQFDPNKHNAVMHVEDETLGQNVIAEVFQKGYRLGDRVLRHTVVKVAN